MTLHLLHEAKTPTASVQRKASAVTERDQKSFPIEAFVTGAKLRDADSAGAAKEKVQHPRIARK